MLGRMLVRNVGEPRARRQSMAVGQFAVSKKKSDPSGSMHRARPVPQPHRQVGSGTS